MSTYRQIDCFNINVKYWKFLGIYPRRDTSRLYEYYSFIFISFFFVFYICLTSLNFLFIPGPMDLFIEETIFYTTEVAVLAKVFTFVCMKDKVVKLLDILESDMFQPDTNHRIKIVKDAKKFNITYWKVMAAISYLSNSTHVLSPLFTHLLTGADLVLPLCSYLFLADSFRNAYIYYCYTYQSVGMHFFMLVNVNVDSFIQGLIILAIAQLDLLDDKLRKVTEKTNIDKDSCNESDANEDIDCVRKLNKCIIHFDNVAKYCGLIEEVFSLVLFVQFSIASVILCVCLFRFTLPAPREYYIFLVTYVFVMVGQILVPCWFGTRVIYKSSQLSLAVYDSDWTPRSRRFKSNLQLLVERLNRPLTIIGGKMFPLSLVTFTSIMNSAYSFFTLLRHMQSREDDAN